MPTSSQPPASSLGAPVFETEVMRLFTDRHREMMLPWFDLHSYRDVAANHLKILSRLKDGSMPCAEEGGPLPQQDVATFEAWIAGGLQTNGSSSGGAVSPGEGGQPKSLVNPGGPSYGPYENYRWRKTNAPTISGTGRYDDIWHLDENVGWAVNSDGYILATRDGWATFVEQKHLPSVRMRCIGFVNDRVGWVGNVGVVEAERLLVTRDGGVAWNFVENLPPNPKQICGLYAVDEHVVYLAGSNENEGVGIGQPTVLKTVDGGATWTAIDMKSAAKAKTLIDVYFEDADCGWVVGGVDAVEHPGRTGSRGDLVPGIFRTTDGGRTWTNVVEGSRISKSGRRYVGRTGEFAQGEWGWKIQRIDDRTLVVVVQNYRDGIILRSDDGGETWERLRINDDQRNSNLEGIGFLDGSIGWVGGYGDITYQPGFSSMTTDGGRNWVEANSAGNRINRFRLIGSPPTVVYASGDTIYKFSDEPVPPAVSEILADAARPPPAAGWDSVQIPFDVPAGTKSATVRIWERDGRFIGTLLNETDPRSGARIFAWNFTNANGEREEVGAFIVRITLDDASCSHMVFRRR